MGCGFSFWIFSGIFINEYEKTRKGLDSPFVVDQPEYLALAQTLGFKIERADLDKLKTGKVYELKRKLKGFEEQIKRVSLF